MLHPKQGRQQVPPDSGMIANQAYFFVESERSNAISIKKIIRNTFQGHKFWMAVFVSPLIFGYLIDAVDGIAKELPSYLIGFQNGFFWHTIFSELQRAESEITQNPALA